MHVYIYIYIYMYTLWIIYLYMCIYIYIYIYICGASSSRFGGFPWADSWSDAVPSRGFSLGFLESIIIVWMEYLIIILFIITIFTINNILIIITTIMIMIIIIMIIIIIFIIMKAPSWYSWRRFLIAPCFARFYTHTYTCIHINQYTHHTTIYIYIYIYKGMPEVFHPS